MFCGKCGSWIDDGDMFCPNCGTPAEASKQQPQPQAMQAPPQPQINVSQNQGQYGYPQNQGQYGYPQAPGQYGYNPAGMSDPMHDPRGMNWFKFIIYVQLFLAAVVNVVNGIQYLTGSLYNGYADSFYYYYPGFKTLDVLIGLICFALAGFCIYTRQRLAKFRKDGPKLFYALYCINIGALLIYLIAASSILRISVGQLLSISPTIPTTIVTSAIFLAINLIYFRNRSDLFKN